MQPRFLWFASFEFFQGKIRVLNKENGKEKLKIANCWNLPGGLGGLRFF
jgi:hypothetical protein